MAKLENLVLLVKSLSKTEKRYFSLFSNFQEGKKEYKVLFQLLDNEKIDFENVRSLFYKKCNNSNFEVTAHYLYQVIIKALINFERDKSIETSLLSSIHEIKILFDRGIFDECLRLIEKTKKLALKHEKYSYFLILGHLELQYLTRLEFLNTNEEELLQKHMKMLEVSRFEQSVNGHSSLYELLFLRYIKIGEARSQKDQEKLTDLVVSELSFVSNPRYNSFEAKKLHLLFQSIYCQMVGDYKSSLRIFYDLNNLFEEHKDLWSENPVYYIYFLKGILTNLRAIKKYNEMRFYIAKLKNINSASASAKTLILQLACEFDILNFIDNEDFVSAKQVLDDFEDKVHKGQKLAMPVDKANIQLYAALTYFGLKDMRTSAKYLNKILNTGRSFALQPVYKLARLINLVVHFEMSNFNYLRYEIRALERDLAKHQKLYQSEKVIFKFFKQFINSFDNKKKRLLLEKCKAELSNLMNDNYENQLLKNFNFLSWINSRMERKQN